MVLDPACGNVGLICTCRWMICRECSEQVLHDGGQGVFAVYGDGQLRLLHMDLSAFGQTLSNGALARVSMRKGRTLQISHHGCVWRGCAVHDLVSPPRRDLAPWHRSRTIQTTCSRKSWTDKCRATKCLKPNTPWRSWTRFPWQEGTVYWCRSRPDSPQSWTCRKTSPPTC